ncbi:MAG: FIG00799921: hypothetical protein [uncultured Sphingomonadaceae bacterium]|uniref:DUF5872 domain-containing protein n=1 Tax=uncultured Sphingomonadaceae bacterium TaxID=169976 RepID=A0A6J4SUG7_9SPHN|nr:MAG: FIG00799921: hypothetical protein [uncultured Sphingomonadaceae bacterium]
MSATAEKSDPKLWEQVKAEITAGDKGGKPGQWSARKAQMAAHEYQKRGGGYLGEKDPHNHLVEWTEEEWGTKSGGESLGTGERYLPRAAREAMTDEEYARTTEAKRHDLAKGKQFSAQPEDVAAKASRVRHHQETKEDLLARAKARGIKGRSDMSKEELRAALED